LSWLQFGLKLPTDFRSTRSAATCTSAGTSRRPTPIPGTFPVDRVYAADDVTRIGVLQFIPVHG
jgi:hypothetical protein